MHIQTSKVVLFQQIQRCQNIVEKRNTNPILTNIHFETIEQDLKLTATDLQATFSSTQAVKVIQQGSFIVDAKKIFDIVRELNPDFEIELKLVDTFLNIVSGGVQFKLATLSPDTFPREPEDETDLTINIAGAELSRLISSTSFAMSTDETRKYLTGSLFEITAEHGMRVVTTDGHRMALRDFHLDGQSDDGLSIVPKKAVLEIKRLADECEGEIRLSLGENQIRVELKQQRFTSKVIDAKYPVYDDVIPKNNPYTAIMDKSTLDQALRRCMVVANDFTHDVKLHFSNNTLNIAAHNTEQEQAHEDMVIEYEGLDIEIGFNAKYMREVLNAVQSQRVRFQLKDSLSPALLLEESHDFSKHVLMPMRI
ncbi:MAG: DNA polymerase III subunit beta [Mariprofundaceae bacterium]|nr:DNA polymerase III subunit beta [Mariprofundaceae bacterium]